MILYPLAADDFLDVLDGLPQSILARLSERCGGKLDGNLIKRFSSLDLSDLSELESIDFTSHISVLRNLSLQRTKVRDITPLRGLAQLQHLYLDQTGVSDVTPLAGLTHLRVLDISHTHIENLAVLNTMPNLHYLNMHGCEKIESLSSLSSLSFLFGIRFDYPIKDISMLLHYKYLTNIYINIKNACDHNEFNHMMSVIRQLNNVDIHIR